MTNKKNILIVGPASAACAELRRPFETLGYALQERVTAGDLIVGTEDPAIDLYVVSLPEAFRAPEAAAGQVARSARKRVLYVTPNASDNIRRELFRAGAGAVLARPFSDRDLLYNADLVMAGDWARFRKNFDETAMLDFLKRLLDQRVEIIEPSLDPGSSIGHFYPAAAHVLGRTAADREILESLASLGLLAREVANRVRQCPECDDVRLNFREVCPECKSLNILQQEMVTHYACAFSAPLQHFRHGGDLICPKCSEKLRHIGVDYEKPSKLFTCFSCECVFRDPMVESQCMRCNCTCPPAQTIERPIYRFLVTPLAQQAVLERRIAGVNLEILLRNTQTGLYSKSYFEHEVKRELVRCERYKSPYSILLVRVNHFDDIASMRPIEATQFAESIFRAVSAGLRTLDTTCVWSEDSLGILLSETPKANARVVVQRIQTNVSKLEFLYSIHKPSVSIGLASNEDNKKNLPDLIAVAEKGIQ